MTAGQLWHGGRSLIAAIDRMRRKKLIDGQGDQATGAKQHHLSVIRNHDDVPVHELASIAHCG